MRVLLLATTTGYQTRSFGEAALRCGIDLVLSTDRCHQLDDPWRDGAVPIRFHEEDASVDLLIAAAGAQRFDGVLALGDRTTVIAARVAARLGLPGNPPEAAAISRSKLATRRALAAAGLPQPWFHVAHLDQDPRLIIRNIRFPCVVKPLVLSGSRGVMRADDPDAFIARFDRLGRILWQKDVRSMRDPENDRILVEGFVPGAEFAVEGLLEHGRLRTLAIFDKPDPLNGPFFEESIYVTPSRLPQARQIAVTETIERAAVAIGLYHGPIHAECRVADDVVVLEIAARPIGGLCARMLEFTDGAGSRVGLEELLLRHAAGEATASFQPVATATGVMMIPIPGRGVYRGVEGLEAALAVAGISEIQMTAKSEQVLVPLPEGASYLGFIFARADTAAEAEDALRVAHNRLQFRLDPALMLVE